MILSDLNELEKLDAARCHPGLCLMGFSLVETLQGIWDQDFHDIKVLPDVFSIEHGPLACIHSHPSKSTIYVHSILNHPATPKAVISLICKHELLHLRIPPRIVKGHLRQHPPEFWEAEKSVAPEHDEAWDWIWRARGRWLRLRPRLERIDVLRGWKRVWDTRDLPVRPEDPALQTPAGRTDQGPALFVGWHHPVRAVSPPGNTCPLCTARIRSASSQTSGEWQMKTT